MDLVLQESVTSSCRGIVRVPEGIHVTVYIINACKLEATPFETGDFIKLSNTTCGYQFDVISRKFKVVICDW